MSVPHDMAMIEARSLSKFYGEFAAIRDVSFTVPQGQVAAFLGPNGAGKSTTLRILTGYLSPSSGKALLAGLDVASHRIKAAGRVGYLPENGPLYPEMTPLELLQFFGNARGLAPGPMKSRIEAVVNQCHLEAVLEKSIFKLSKGYRQRVGMAQVLLHEPDILIMDEPTSGLDPNQIHDVRELIRTLGRTKTILISTHILQEVQAIADRVVLVNDGRVVFDGTVEEMAAGQTLEEAFYRLTGRSERPPETRPPSGTDASADGAASAAAAEEPATEGAPAEATRKESSPAGETTSSGSGGVE